MSKEKQIEEMAFDLCLIDRCKHLPQEECHNTTCAHCEAEALYNAGYRKQSEGEWIERDCITESKRGRTIHYSTQKCSVCGRWNGRHKTNFCPNCGAKMKGGE
jgi:hypothetical protein